MENDPRLLQGFDEATPALRLQALAARLALFENGTLPKPAPTEYVNNHIHTIYSFSPYSPTAAAYMAWVNGLTTAGIMDHDSVAGCEEFIAAGAAIGIATTAGFECRCRMDDTPFAGRRINNPDQRTVIYCACHGIPHQNLARAEAFLAPLRTARNVRNRKMVENINGIMAPFGIGIDFEREVLPLSQSVNGGSVTERHLLYALAFAITAKVGKGAPVLELLEKGLGLAVAGKNRETLQNPATPGYEYALLGVLKGGFVEQFYLPATDECPPVADFIAFARGIGAIPAYAYLGDVGDSVTGDKKAQTFEDDYLDELVPWLARAGFLSITYMPTRNTPAQLKRLMALCAANGLFEISGEDINSPSQSFICKALDEAEYKHLIENTWALIGHEKAASARVEDGMFSEKTVAQWPQLPARIAHFAKIGSEKG